MARIWRQHPNTTMLAFTRAGANLIDDLSIEAFYRKRQPLATVDGNIESWEENYDEHRQLKPSHLLRPRPVPIYPDMP
eukprot:1785548-Karenia_brevis.AAC.1